MQSSDALSRMQKVFREVFEDNHLIVTPATTSKDIDDWDSVAQVKLVMAIEQEFGIQLEEDELTIRNVGGFIEAVLKQCS
jgi:acyl carrier protein